MRSRGSVEFAALGWSGLKCKDLLGFSPSYASQLKGGTRRPTEALRRLIHEHGGPEPGAWDELLPEPVAARAPAAADGPLPEPTEADAVSEAARTLREIQVCRSELTAAALAPAERVRFLSQLGALVVQLGRLTGAGLELSERAILTSPNWRLIKDRILAALAPFPEAARAAADALDPPS